MREQDPRPQRPGRIGLVGDDQLAASWRLLPGPCLPRLIGARSRRVKCAAGRRGSTDAPRPKQRPTPRSMRDLRPETRRPRRRRRRPGARLGAERPKQYLPCAGKPLLAHTLEALLAAWPFSAVTVAIHADDRALYDEALAQLSAEAAGGDRAAGDRRRDAAAERARRARGARRGGSRPRAHSRRRPPVSLAELVARAVEAAEAHGAAAPGTPLSDTVKQVDGDGRVLGDAAARELARRADAAGVPLPADPRGAPARGDRGRRATSPTTSPSPNGPARRPSSSRAIRRTSR